MAAVTGSLLLPRSGEGDSCSLLISMSVSESEALSLSPELVAGGRVAEERLLAEVDFFPLFKILRRAFENQLLI